MTETAVEQAYREYFDTYGEDAHQPDRTASGLETRDGSTYIVLRNVNGVLAVYTATSPLMEVEQGDWYPLSDSEQEKISDLEAELDDLDGDWYVTRVRGSEHPEGERWRVSYLRFFDTLKDCQAWVESR